MSIPKILHYCWFGGSELPKEYQQYIAKWQLLMPDYKIIRWDENSVDLNCNSFVQSAYNAKKWAFVSDYFRLKALFECGGVYLDTDVEVYKPFDSLLEDNFFCGYIWNCLIGTAVIGTEKGSKIIKDILDQYDAKGNFELVPNNHIFTEYFLKQKWFQLNGREKIHQGIHIYPKEYFEIPPIVGKGFSCHHIANSWHDTQPIEGSIKKVAKRLIPYGIWRQMGAKKALQMSDYYEIYKKYR